MARGDTKDDLGRHGDHRRGDRTQQLRRFGSQAAGAGRFIAGRFIIGEYVSRAGEGVSLAIHPPGQWHPGRVAAGRVQVGRQRRSGGVVRGSRRMGRRLVTPARRD
ncbi:MAG: hypothetical protein ABSB59_34660 [Streptosporangiaceae bacterium]